MTSEPLEKTDIAAEPDDDADEPVLGIPWLTKGRVARLVKFGIVGLSGVGVNLAVFEFVYRIALTSISSELRVTLANAAGLVVSIFTNFLLNDFWTWGDRLKGTLKHWLARVGKYYVSASAAGVVQLVVTWATFRYVFKFVPLTFERPSFVQEWFGATGEPVIDLSPTVAVLTGIGCGMVINFLASHLWAFRAAEVES